MKKFFVIIGLLVISLFMFGCTNGTFAGKAVEAGGFPVPEGLDIALCGNGQFDQPGEECEYYTPTNNLVPSPGPGDAIYLNNMNCNKITFSDGSVKQFAGGTLACKNCKANTDGCGAKLICTPNEWYCKDGSEQPLRVQCNWDGTNFTAPVACPNGQSCQITEKDDTEVGVCVPMVCTPNEKICKDSLTKRTCFSSGLGAYNTKCLKGKICVKGNCITPGCGNNVAEAGEACDGTDLAGKQCTDINFYGNYNFASGQLKCTGCQFITTSCVKPTCMSMFGVDKNGHPYTCFHKDDVNKPSGELYQVYEVPCDVTQGAYGGQPGEFCAPNTNSTLSTAGSIS